MLRKLNLFLAFVAFTSFSFNANSALNEVSTNNSNHAKELETSPILAPALAAAEPQNVDEVIKWKTSVQQNGCEATLIVEVTQLDGWHLYSQILPENAMNIPTTFKWDGGSGVELKGKTSEPHTDVVDNDGFPERPFHGNKVVFKQKVTITDGKAHEVKMSVEFMACKESCFPPSTKNFTFKLKDCGSENGTDEPDPEEDPQTEESSDTLNVEETNVDTLEVPEKETMNSPIGWQFYAMKMKNGNIELRAQTDGANGWYILNNETKATFDVANFEVIEASVIDGKTAKIHEMDSTIKGPNGSLEAYNGGVILKTIIKPGEKADSLVSGILKLTISNGEQMASTVEEYAFTINLNEAVEEHETTKTTGSMWAIFWKAFLGGLVALLTPCVFPMIPMTVSFFTKGAENRRKGLIRGVTYGISIFLIYILLSAPFHLLDSLDPSILNKISTNVPLNIFFFVMLVVFAFSFLGAFEITLPASWTNKVDNKASSVGGFIGIFLMALTLAIVSFSCTGPILGSLLVGASSGGGGAWQLTAGMAGFGIALGLPFALFAIFPSMLKTIEGKSGGWLNSVKVVLGFLELAFAFKFLSNADLAVQAHLLERELFLAIWIAIFGAMTLYLFGAFKTSHDSPVQYLTVTRLSFAIISLMFTLYMIPGLWGAPLKLISAFPPPQHYSESPYGVGGQEPVHGDMPEGAHAGPHGLPCFHDYEKARAYAEEIKKPLMLDFTGHNCVNCRKMEANVWSDESNLPILRDSVVIASLYVDEKLDLPQPEKSPFNGKMLYTTGEKWADLQSEKFGKTTQPQYVILNHRGEMLSSSDATYASHSDPDKFNEWLLQGLKAFEERANIKTHFPELEVTEAEETSLAGGPHGL